MNRIDPASPFGHKIRPRQRERLAVVYIRQSTPQQVASNRESTDLQYQLQQRAVALGWVAERVMVIDDDQGIRGTSVQNRPGFQRLLAEISLGHIGIVFGREMSRLTLRLRIIRTRGLPQRGVALRTCVGNVRHDAVDALGLHQ